jgi:hypothetical protein
LAVLVGLAFTALLASLFILPVAAEAPRRLLYVVPVFFLSLIGVAPLVIFVLLVGYVWGDARRRRMNHVLWTLLAAFIPGAVGLILYFILRDPVPVPCPSCGTPALKGHAFCSECGCEVRVACPQCRQPIEPGWRNCTHCGASLRPGPSGTAPTAGA